ncbi:MAG: hypothetical protein Q9159_006504 [Coniocarpon cinnabarinum]
MNGPNGIFGAADASAANGSWATPSQSDAKTATTQSTPLVTSGDDWDAASQHDEGWGNGADAGDDSAQPDAAQKDATIPNVDPKKYGWVEKEQLNSLVSMAAEKDLVGRSDVPQWSSEARKYEWHDDYGEVGPEDPELEHELFEETYRTVKGEDIGLIGEIEVELSSQEQYKAVDTMDQAGLHPLLLENLKKAGYGQTTPIQAYTIPVAMAGKDVLGVSQTGSGKTVAFLTPVLSKLMGKARQLAKPKPNPDTYDQNTNGITAEPLVLIIVPTRELAQQIHSEARRLCYRSMLRPCCVYGGASTAIQINDLMRGCDILIGTPGRLRDLVTTRGKALSLARLKYTILDEADELLDVDWEDQLAPMITGPTAYYSEDRQYMMFSATFNRAAREAASKFLSDEYVRITVGRLGSTHRAIHQVLVWSEDDYKRKALIDVLMALPVARTMVFCASIDRAIAIDDFLYRMNFPSNALTSRMTQREREEAMAKFRRGSSPILVTTSLAGRGIDVERVQHVVNYDMPSVQQGGIGTYCHQIGRTGRIGNKGQATSFINDRCADLLPDLAKLLLECDHSLPEWLEPYAPVDGIVKWDDDGKDGDDPTTTDPFGTGNGQGAGDSWGGGGSGGSGGEWKQGDKFDEPAATSSEA